MASKTKSNGTRTTAKRNGARPKGPVKARPRIGPVPVEQRPERALEVIRKHSATPAEVAEALHLEGSWAPQQAVAALERLVRSGEAKKRSTKDGQTVYMAA
ncbi:MAG: hypothetical protein AB7W59_00390 [Acidimicrobiia bacterium]